MQAAFSRERRDTGRADNGRYVNSCGGVKGRGAGQAGIFRTPGVDGQEATRDELMNSLHDTLQEALVLNREDAYKAAHPN